MQIRDPGYLKALNLPNIELITDGIDTITEKGIRCKSGEEHEVDVLILGTGFDTSTGGIGINVRGCVLVAARRELTIRQLARTHSHRAVVRERPIKHS